MKISLNWLRRYIDLEASVDEIQRGLTLLGFEVEGIQQTGLSEMPGLVIGEILTREKHPNADRLSVCSVRIDASGEPQQIVCGAPNCDAGCKVVVATPGCVLPGNFKIKKSRIRGVESNGMMCSARELGLGDDHDGIITLDTGALPGTPAHEVLGDGDVIFDIEVTPNRPDALSHLGIARELAAWFDRPLQYPHTHFEAPAEDLAEAGHRLLEDVAVLADEACPLYTAHVIEGVKIAPSPRWLQEHLTAIGLRPINNVVDITNFVLHETGQPLHAFDAAKIRGRRLIIRHAENGEKIVTLDDKERTLSRNDLVIADAERALVVAGIMGGADAEVDDTTVDLVLEAAYFKPIGVRRTSRALGLSSDSSYRFERGVDPRGVLPAARRAIDLILEIAGGRVLGPVHIVGSEPVWEREIRLSPDFVRERLGFAIADEEQQALLGRLELDASRVEEDDDGRKTFVVSIPSWRSDLDRPIDLVEEILRVYGTDRIPATRPVAGAVVSEDDPIARYIRSANTALVGKGFLEVMNYTLRSAEEIATWSTAAACEELKIENPLAEDQSHLRVSLVPGLLDTIRFNQAHGNLDGLFFETGRTFREEGGEIYEMVSVAFAIAQPEDAAAWKRREAPDFYYAKRLVLELAALAGMNIRDDQFRLVDGDGPWQAGHAATVDGGKAGYEAALGLVDLALTRRLDIDGPVLAGSFSILPERLRGGARIPRSRPVSAFPAASRDLALVCDEATPAATVHNALARAVRKAVNNAFDIEAIRLFDVYRGKGVEEGRKSLAFTMTFRAADRTLKDEEVARVFEAVQAAMEAAGFPVRR